MRSITTKNGFTLLEVLVTIGIIAMLATITIIAVNPKRNFSAAHNTQRSGDLQKILGALNQYAIEQNGAFPAGVTTTLQMLGTATSTCNVICGPDTLASVINSFLDNSLITFASGTYASTQWNTPIAAIDLTAAGLTAKTGTYTSSIKDAASAQTWNTISWTPGAPHNKELPNAAATETSYPAGNASMTGNRMLLHLNETSGALVDTSGNTNNGTINGAVGYNATGKLNKALSWPGTSNNYVSIANNATLNLPNTGGSVMLWIQPTLNLAANTGMGVIRKPDYGANLNTPGGYGIEIFRTNSGGPHNLKVHLGWNNGSTNSQQILLGTTNLISGQWYHVALTWNTTTVTIYVNGVQDIATARVNGQLNWASNTAALDIGRNSDSISSNRAWYNGLIDEVALFNRTLSAPEILDFYKRGALKLRHQVRSCNDSACSGETFIGPDGTAATYYDNLASASLTTPSFTLTNVPVNRYFQYKTYFDTDTSSFGPTLQNVAFSNSGSGTVNTTSTASTANACLNLAPTFVPTYLPALPIDPLIGSAAKTYYAVQSINNGASGIGLLIRACSPELGQAIETKQ